jgi:uroporphyrinogen decarboxylase
MNERERCIATFTYAPVDKIPFEPGYGRKSTRERWMTEGLPQGADVMDEVYRILGLPPRDKSERISPRMDFRMIPQFEEKVLEHRPASAPGMRGTLIVQDWKGNVCEISDEFNVEYLRNAIDFVTRAWIKCPVESWADWRDMQKRYDPCDPRQFPADWKDRAAKLRNRNYISGLGISGPFWQMREWLGFENLCTTFHDDTKMIEDMVEFWENFVAELLEKMFADYVPDWIMINEDMAYKEKPMISPEMSRKYLLRSWKRWGEICRKAGVKLYEVDSDGYVGSLLPVFIEGGFNINSPLEVAAGNDLPAFRRQYGKKIAYRGGVDKRAIAKGGQAIRDEINRLRPVIESGGYLPSCDHGVPADVSWPNFLDYARLLAQATGWLR